MSDKAKVPVSESGEVVTSKDKFVRSMKSASHSAWRELTLDSRLSYASRAYIWLGNRVIGTPEQLGIAGADDFFADEEDRGFPKGELADDSFEQRKQILLDDFRQDLRYGAAKLVALVGMLLCTAILMLGQASLSGYQKAQAVRSDMKAERAVEALEDGDFSQAKIFELKTTLEQAKAQGRTTVKSLTTRERAALEEYKQRPGSDYANYPIIDQE